MSRRSNRRRRDERREREPRRDLHPEPVPVDHELLRAKVMHTLTSGRCRGSKEPLCQRMNLVFGPVVQLDTDDPTPMPQQLAERTIQELLRLTRDQKPS